MAAEHDDFVFLVGAGNLCHRVVRSFSFRIKVIGDLEFQFDGSAIGQRARNPSIILIAQHHRRQHLGYIISPVLECPDLPVLAPRIIHSNERVVGH